MSSFDMDGDLDDRLESERRAFESLAPASAMYATMSIEEAFNWPGCARAVQAGEWYLVAFRSVRSESADDSLLTELDDRAHAEAMRSPGFIHYFRGSMGRSRECLSFCLWDTRDQAQAAAAGPAHQVAVGRADEMYDSYVLEYLTIRKRPGSFEFEFEPLGARRVH